MVKVLFVLSILILISNSRSGFKIVSEVNFFNLALFNASDAFEINSLKNTSDC